jgi:hypothetical protein
MAGKEADTSASRAKIFIGWNPFISPCIANRPQAANDLLGRGRIGRISFPMEQNERSSWRRFLRSPSRSWWRNSASVFASLGRAFFPPEPEACADGLAAVVFGGVFAMIGIQ